MNSRAMFCLATGVLLIATGARAESGGDDFDRRGWYVGAGFAYGFSDFGLRRAERTVAQEFGVDSATLDADDSPGSEIRGGYRLLPNFALEGQFQYFRDADINLTETRTQGVVDTDEVKLGRLESFSFTANAKGYALTGRWQPYGLVGVGALSGRFRPTRELRRLGADSSDDTVFAARFGAGLDVYATRNIVIDIECSYLLATSDYEFHVPVTARGNGSLIPFVVGAQYRF